GAIGHTSGRLF
nr:immunoglobulin light chain junction region [Macaca mulatta]